MQAERPHDTVAGGAGEGGEGVVGVIGLVVSMRLGRRNGAVCVSVVVRVVVTGGKGVPRRPPAARRNLAKNVGSGSRFFCAESDTIALFQALRR